MIEIPQPGRVDAGKPTLANAPDAPRGFFAGRGIDVPYNRTRVSPDAFGNTSGLENVNRALQGVMAKFGEQAAKTQQAVNTGHIIEADTQTKIGLQGLMQDIQSSEDPAKWLETYQQRAPSVLDKVLNPDGYKLAPAAQERIRNNFATTYGSYAVSVMRSGETERVSRARQQGMHAIDMDVRAGLLSDAFDKLDTLVAEKVIPASDRDEIKLGLEAKQQLYQGEAMLDSDPKRLEYMLERTDENGNEFYRKLDPDVRNRLHRRAKEASVRMDEMAIDEFSKRIDEGAPPTPEEIEAFAKGNDLVGQEFVDNAMKTFYSANPRPLDKIVFNRVKDDIAKYDPENDPMGVQRARFKSTISSLFEGEPKAALLEDLGNLVSASKRVDNAPANAAAKVFAKAYTEGFFGTTDRTKGDPLVAVERRALAEDKFGNWLKQNPKAGVTEATKAARDFISAPAAEEELERTMGVRGSTGQRGDQMGGFTAGEQTVYWPGPKSEAKKYGLSGAVEGGTKDAHGNVIWGNTTYEDYLEGKGDYVTVAMDIESDPFKQKAYLTSPQHPGVVFRVMDNGGYGNGRTGTGWVDIAFKDPQKALTNKQRNVEFNIISKAEAERIAASRGL